MPLSKKNINILLVDDEKELVEIMYDLLTSEGYAVIIVNNGDDAIEAVKKKPFDIIFMDQKMRGLSGIETCKEIKKITPKTAVFLLSGIRQGLEENLIKKAKEAGIQDFIAKPFRIDNILEIVEKVAQEK